MKPDPLRKEFGLSMQRVRDGFIIAFIGMVFSVPQIRYQSPWVYAKFAGRTGTASEIDQFFIAHLITILSALLIIVLVGDLANRRAELVPFKWPGRKNIRPSVAIGLLFIPASYFLYDHFLIALMPRIFPDKLSYALLFPFSVTFPDELFVRFGFLALFAWMLKRFSGGKLMANIFVAGIFSLFSWYDVTRFLSAPLKTMEILLLLAGTFAENIVAGGIYFKHGFWSSLAFRVAAALKFPVYFMLFF